RHSTRRAVSPSPSGYIPLLVVSPKVPTCLLDNGRSIAATPVANGAERRQSAALSEFGPPVLNGLLRSVNRKVRGSSPRPGRGRTSFELRRESSDSSATSGSREHPLLSM